MPRHKSGHRASRTSSPSDPRNRENAHDGSLGQPISQFIFTHKSGLPVPRPPAQSLHTTPPHNRKARTQPAGRRMRRTRLFLHSPLPHSPLTLCVVSRGSFTCASHRRQLRYTGIELTVQRLVTIRAAGASSERERASPPRGALQARHVVSIQSSAIPSRVTAHHQGARVQHTPRSVRRVPRAVVMFRHVSSCSVMFHSRRQSDGHQWPSDGNHGSSAAIGWASRPRMSHDCHLMATDEP